MRYCLRCLYPENHPLGITFDNDGICSGCRVHEEKDRLDWQERGQLLKRIFADYRCKNSRSYDCIIPVSGARDSYFIVHTVKNVLGMNPLLVTYNKHYNTARGIRNLAYLRTLLGCDILTQTVGTQTVKKITRHTLRRIGSMYWHCLAGQSVFPVQTAVRFKIPLIVWGCHQGCDQVGMFSHLDEVEMTRKYRKEHDLMGLEAEDIAGHDGIDKDEIKLFEYPHDKELEQIGVRGIYLNNYLRWDSKAQHEQMINSYGYESCAQRRTFDTYNDVDCFHYSDLHDYIKYLKWGYGKATDHACREIRLRRISREEGLDLVQRYQGIEPDAANLKMFLDWLGMSNEELFSHIDRFRDSRVWDKSGAKWSLKDSVLAHRFDKGIESARLTLKEGESKEFIITGSRDSRSAEDKYVLIGRGWAARQS